MKKNRETSNLKHLCRNELDKACLADDAEYSDSKNLAKGTISDNILNNRAYKIARNIKYDGYKKNWIRSECK